MKRALAGTLLLLAACGEGTTDPEPEPAIAGVEASSAVTQDGTVGQPVAERAAVRVTGTDGRPFSGAQVTWSVVSGGGSVDGDARTGSDGVARAVWTLGTVAGENRLQARAGSLPAVVFTATARPGDPAEIVIAPDSVLLDLPGDTARLTATLRDEYGNTLPASAFTWSSSDEAVLTVDAAGLLTVAGAGAATISAATGEVTGSADGVVDLPVLSVPMVDLDLMYDFAVFGEHLTESRLNPTYELMMDDDSMEVRAVGAGWVEYIEDQGDDGSIMIRTSDVWAVHYDHVVDIRVAVGDSVETGDVIGLVAHFADSYEGGELVALGRVELQVNHGRNNTQQLAWCPALFGTPEFNAAHDAALARSNPNMPGTCIERTVVP